MRDKYKEGTTENERWLHKTKYSNISISNSKEMIPSPPELMQVICQWYPSMITGCLGWIKIIPSADSHFFPNFINEKPSKNVYQPCELSIINLHIKPKQSLKQTVCNCTLPVIHTFIETNCILVNLPEMHYSPLFQDQAASMHASVLFISESLI